jgi:hypothetical protein
MNEADLENKRNVLGGPLAPCCFQPITGWFRDGYCRTDERDFGQHNICSEVNEKFLAFTMGQGNDLSTPKPEFGFPGLKPGDGWCLCASRWKQAEEAGMAPPVILEACEESALRIVPLEKLMEYAVIDEGELEADDASPQVNPEEPKPGVFLISPISPLSPLGLSSRFVPREAETGGENRKERGTCICRWGPQGWSQVSCSQCESSCLDLHPAAICRKKGWFRNMFRTKSQKTWPFEKK